MNVSRLVGLLAMLALVGCGAVGPPNKSSLPPDGGQSPQPQGETAAPFITMVVKPGIDATEVGRRIVGANAIVQLAPQTPQENLPTVIRRSTYRVTVEQGHECEALTRARNEPGVMRAYLGEYPGQYPDC
jgi:hypothetical protein